MRLATWALTLLAAVPCAAAEPNDPNALLEAATREAAAKVAPSVVKIETSGGTDTVGKGRRRILKGTGPTTGVVVDPGGYVITSSFNFANNPTDIFVTVPGKPRQVAKVVAADETRMLTLLKIDAKELKVPFEVPKEDIRIGEWALALGRTLNPDMKGLPSISGGIVSAKGRVWGKMLQTDAKVSPVNYGGPLVAIDGRVQGILVPASPRGAGETAGVEWYDSGIGFAVPFEDVLRVLPRLKKGENLRAGLLGFRPKSSDMYADAPVIGTVSPNSAASRAGLKAGDRIVAVDGTRTANQAQVMHKLRPLYEGDTVTLVVRRDGKEKTFRNMRLGAPLSSFAFPSLGILPMRDDPEAGVEIRYVFPKSPADRAGLKAGDRLTQLAPATSNRFAKFAGRDQFQGIIKRFPIGTEVKFKVKRKGGKSEEVRAALGVLAGEVPAGPLPVPSTRRKALEKPKRPAGPKKGPKKAAPPKKKADGKKAEVGFLERKDAALAREYWMFVPENYDPNVSHGVVLWLHDRGRGGKDSQGLIDAWGDYCNSRHCILLAPKSANDSGWTGSELEPVLGLLTVVAREYTVDAKRVVAHGLGVGGRFAFYMAFNAPDRIAGVATASAPLATKVKDSAAGNRLSFFIAAGEKDPLVKQIAKGAKELTDKKFPVVYREIKGFGKEYVDVDTLKELFRWIDALDRS